MRYEGENQRELVPRDYNPPPVKPTCRRCRKKPPFFIATFCCFLGLVQVIVFHLKAVENVLLFRQDRDERIVNCHLGVRCRASTHSAANAGASYPRSDSWAYLKANVFLSVGVKNGIVWCSAVMTGRHSWHLRCSFLHIQPEKGKQSLGSSGSGPTFKWGSATETWLPTF